MGTLLNYDDFQKRYNSNWKKNMHKLQNQKKRKRPKIPFSKIIFTLLIGVILAFFLVFVLRKKEEDSTTKISLEDQVYNRIYDQIMEHQTKLNMGIIDLHGNLDILNDTFQKVLNEHPEIFWLSPASQAYGKDNRSRYMYTLTCFPSCDMNDVPQMQKHLNENVADIVRQANDAGKTDYEKAAFVHDYIVKHCVYDEETYLRHLVAMPNVTSQAYTSYGCIVDNNAVCEGYAKAYMLIMNELGIECGLVTGTAKNSTGSSGGHAWNYINLDGDYYMVDVTWDDPVGLSSDYCSHDYFCITTEQILKDHTISEDENPPLCEGGKYSK